MLCVALMPAWPALGEVISYTNGAAAVYGSPSVEGDTLLFNPTAFSSRCSGSQGVDMIDGLMRVWIASSENIEKVTVNEGGAWFFFGPGTAATQAYVGALGAELVITEVNGVAPTGGLSMIPGTMTFTPSSANVGSRTFKATEPVDSAGWQGTMTFDDVDAALVGTPYQGQRVTGAMLVFDNVLATTSETGTVAFIDKKWVAITTTPEPEAFVILVEASTLGFLYWLLKRRKAELSAFRSWFAETVAGRSGGGAEK